MNERVEANVYIGSIVRMFNEKDPQSVLIAGDTILSLMVEKAVWLYKSIDLYVGVNHASDVLEVLYKTLKTNINHISLEVSLDKPTFCRNVLMVYTIRGLFNDIRCEFKVMVTSIPPISVVTNFDLTCRQMWYDGFNVNGTHTNETLKGKVALKKGYVDLPTKDITYLNKYQLLGFTVHVEDGFFINDYGPSHEEMVIRHIINIMMVFPSNWYNKVYTYNSMMSGNTADYCAVTEPLRITIPQLFCMATKGYTVKNLISTFNLTPISLGNLIYVIVMSNSYTELCDLTLKVFKPYFKEDIFAVLSGNVSSKNKTPHSPPNTTPFNHNIPFTFDSEYKMVDVGNPIQEYYGESNIYQPYTGDGIIALYTFTLPGSGAGLSDINFPSPVFEPGITMKFRSFSGVDEDDISSLTQNFESMMDTK